MAAAPIYDENPRVAAIMNRVSELAVLPHVVYKVLELSGSADSSTSDLERAIVVDPGFSSRILTIANSAYYGLPRKVTSIKEALLFLGFKAIRQLAMTVGVYDVFVGKTDKDSLRRRTWWRHSVDSAVCARWLAGEFRALPGDDAYTCGLLHCIGKTLLDRFGGEEYARVGDLVKSGVALTDAERELYGCTHVEVGQVAAEKWGFPEELVAGMDYLSIPRPNEPYLKHRAVVAVASQIADLAIEGATTEEEMEMRELCAWALEALGISDAKQQECIDKGMRAIAAAAQMQM